MTVHVLKRYETFEGSGTSGSSSAASGSAASGSATSGSATSGSSASGSAASGSAASGSGSGNAGSLDNSGDVSEETEAERFHRLFSFDEGAATQHFLFHEQMNRLNNPNFMQRREDLQPSDGSDTSAFYSLESSEDGDIGGCVGTRFGCCPGSTNAKDDLLGTNCTKKFTCQAAKGPTRSVFGCCENGEAMTDASGTNCAAMVVDRNNPYTPAPLSKGRTCATFKGPVYSAFGCCENGEAMIDASGTNCALAVTNYPPPLPSSCAVSLYGCCPDGATNRTQASDLGCPALTNSDPSNMYAGVMPQNTDTVFIPPPMGFGAQPAAVAPAEAPASKPPTLPPPPPPVQQQKPPESGTYGKCPPPRPCPPCARCPEPAFECKKVPNYERTDNERFVPQAILTDFSSFGM